MYMSARGINKFYALDRHPTDLHRELLGPAELVFQLNFWSKSEIIRFGKILKLNKGIRLLDVGSGYGGPACCLSEKFHCKVTGVELSKINYAFSKQLNVRKKLGSRVHFLNGDILKKKFSKCTFDRIIMIDSLVHIGDRKKLFRRFSNWLRPRGKILIAVECIMPNIPSNIKAQREKLGVVYCETESNYENLFESFGYRIISKKVFGTKRHDFASLALRWMKRNNHTKGVKSMRMIQKLGKLNLAREVLYVLEKDHTIIISWRKQKRNKG